MHSGFLLGSRVLEAVFFFFEQKTAYELRISDWSSDVCSSDLLGAQRHIPARDLMQIALEALQLFPQSAAGNGDADLFGLVVLQPLLDGRDKIGRASCRERVCQYVKI